MGDTPTLRSCIISEIGYTFLSLDASQVELRVAAILSQDPNLLEDLRTGDLHQATAARMWGWIEDEDQRKKKRYDAKQVNFAIIYMADVYKVAQMSECSEEEAELLMSEHRQAYPRFYQWRDERIAQAKEDGYVQNIFGRIRPLPELYAGSWKMREKAEREVVNTLCQGTASDVVKLAMIYLREVFDPTIRLVLQVHDEILWECPDTLLQQSLEQCQELKQASPQYPFSIQTGKVYGSMEDVKNGQT